MNVSSFTFILEVPRSVAWRSSEGLRTFEREDFYAFLWQEFGEDRGLVGIHEGSVLSEEAFEAGLETESWTLDSAEAPRERDWVQSQETENAVVYFSLPEHAHAARARIVACTGLSAGEIVEEKPQDWDAEWKKTYQGAFVPPNWEVRPPWIEVADIPKGHILLKLNPGAGFGTGTHETTQLCLQAIANVCEESSRAGRFPVRRVLDFGSGSGILSIGAALLGAQVDGIEIDPLANDNARENADLNGLGEKIRFSESLADASGKYPLVIANILRPVLIEFAPELVSRIEKGGSLILSGLIETDLPEVIARYSALLGGRTPERRELGEWRALVFQNVLG